MGYGLAGDVGAAYFFTPHVSLGASGELSARYSATHRDFGVLGQQDVKNYNVVFALNLLGAVYF